MLSCRAANFWDLFLEWEDQASFIPGEAWTFLYFTMNNFKKGGFKLKDIASLIHVDRRHNKIEIFRKVHKPATKVVHFRSCHANENLGWEFLERRERERHTMNCNYLPKNICLGRWVLDFKIKLIKQNTIFGNF